MGIEIIMRKITTFWFSCKTTCTGNFNYDFHMDDITISIIRISQWSMIVIGLTLITIPPQQETDHTIKSIAFTHTER